MLFRQHGANEPCWHDRLPEVFAAALKLRIQLSSQDSRPLVAGKSDEELLRFVTESLARREPFYTQAAYTLQGTDEELAEQVAALIHDMPGKR